MTINYTLIGGDGKGWALDQTLNYIKYELLGFENWRFVRSIQLAQVVFIPWYYGYLTNRRLIRNRQIVVCIMENDIQVCYPDFLDLPYITEIDFWIVHNTTQKKIINSYQLDSFLMPYPNNIEQTSSLVIRDYVLEEVQELNRLSVNNYLLFLSVQRDSSPYMGGWVPKTQKNPEYLLALYQRIYSSNTLVRLVLAGPRRHWIVNKLKQLNLPYVQINAPHSQRDDYLNMLNRSELTELYKSTDFQLITSKWEGGPLSLLEAFQAGQISFSTPVGIAPDMLPSELLLTGELDKDIKSIERITSIPQQKLKAYQALANRYNKIQHGDFDKLINAIQFKIEGRSKSYNVFIDFFYFAIEMIIGKLLGKLNVIRGK